MTQAQTKVVTNTDEGCSGKLLNKNLNLKPFFSSLNFTLLIFFGVCLISYSLNNKYYFKLNVIGF